VFVLVLLLAKLKSPTIVNRANLMINVSTVVYLLQFITLDIHV